MASGHRRGRRRAMVLALAAAVVAAGTGCATPTPYQGSRGADGHGYYDQQIEDDRYVVGFAGNTVTPRRTVETYLLYRAAEVTLASGHDWFVIADRSTDASTRYTGWVDGFPGGFGWGGYGGGGSGVGVGVGLATMTANPATRYTAEATIVVFSGEKPKDNVNAYDAREVIERLGPTLVYPEAKD